MAKVNLLHPEIVVLEYRQETTDKDYGSCLWAKFYFDTTNYKLLITSDCGEYGYGWCPDDEPFLKFMTGVRKDYLLEKISNRSIIDKGATFEEVKDYILELTEGKPNVDYDEYELQNACSYNTLNEIYNALTEIFDSMELDYDSEWLCSCIAEDYSYQAQKIVDVFIDYIQPQIKRIIKGE